jgi:hypothetical protein
MLSSFQSQPQVVNSSTVNTMTSPVMAASVRPSLSPATTAAAGSATPTPQLKYPPPPRDDVTSDGGQFAPLPLSAVLI